MKKRKYVILIICSFLVFVTAGITYAWAINHSSGTATNVVTVGKVSIQLKNETTEDGMIYPEQPVGKDITVTNNGEYAAYIRLKIKKSWAGYQGMYTLSPTQVLPNQTPSKDAIVLNVKEGWWKGKSECEGYDYYYYNKIVPTEKEIVFMNDYYIATRSESHPDGLTNDLLQEYQGSDISIKGEIYVQAEAIQADYYTPEMDGEHIVSWPVMMEPKVTSTPVVMTNTDEVAVVSFNSRDVELSGRREDTFLDLTEILPGETKTKGVFIANNTGKTVPVYLYAKIPEEYNKLSPEEQKEQMDLLNHLLLTVGNEKKQVIYYGPLFEINDTKEMLSAEYALKLGEYKPLEGEVIYVSVHLPATWTKGSLNSKVNWIFSIEKKEAPEETLAPTTVPVISAKPTVSPMSTAVILSSASPLPTVSTMPEYTIEPIQTSQPVQTLNPEQTPMFYTEAPKPTVKPTNPGFEVNASMFPALNTKNPLVDLETPEGGGEPVKKEPTITATHATKTGDATPIYFWMVLCFVSMVGMITVGKSLKN